MKNIKVRKVGNSIGIILPKESGLQVGDLLGYKQDGKKLIYEWEVELEIPLEKIRKFVQSIEASLRMVSEFPEMHEEISSVYSLSELTYRILIGKQFALFYRLNHDKYDFIKLRTTATEIPTIFEQ
jgi:predicted NUDIX family NTP pyrophosphohydrolase